MTTVTTWPCVYQIFDYHLSEDSKNTDAGMDAGVSIAIDADSRPLGDGFGIGINEYLDFTIYE